MFVPEQPLPVACLPVACLLACCLLPAARVVDMLHGWLAMDGTQDLPRRRRGVGMVVVVGRI